MKRFFLSAILILLCCSIYAKDGIVFEIKPKVSFYAGHQGEYVFTKYLESSKTKSAKLSELKWDVTPLCFLGLDFSGNIKKFCFTLGADFAVASNTGFVIDSDWKNVSNLPNYDVNKTYLLTNFTKSKNSTNSFFEINAKFSYDFKLSESAAIAPFLEGEYNYILMDAWGLDGRYCSSYTDANGYYGAWDEVGSRVIYYSEETKVLSLERHWGMVWLGADFKAGMNNKFFCGVSMACMPFVFCLSQDTHWLRSNVFKDLGYGIFLGGKMGLSFGWNITPKDAISFDFDFKGMMTMNGNIYSGTTKSEYFVKDYTAISGADFESMKIKLAYIKRF